MLVAAAVLASSTGIGTRLSIDVWPKGRADVTGHRHYTLRCAPAKGTVPHPGTACTALNKLQHPFAPTPPGTVCPMLVLGPQEAHVVGTVRGVRVNAWLNLVHCGVDRWDRVKAIVPEPDLALARADPACSAGRRYDGDHSRTDPRSPSPVDGPDGLLTPLSFGDRIESRTTAVHAKGTRGRDMVRKPRLERAFVGGGRRRVRVRGREAGAARTGGPPSASPLDTAHPKADAFDAAPASAREPVAHCDAFALPTATAASCACQPRRCRARAARPPRTSAAAPNAVQSLFTRTTSTPRTGCRSQRRDRRRR